MGPPLIEAVVQKKVRVLEELEANHVDDTVAHRGDSVAWMALREHVNGDCGNSYGGGKK